MVNKRLYPYTRASTAIYYFLEFWESRDDWLVSWETCPACGRRVFVLTMDGVCRFCWFEHEEALRAAYAEGLFSSAERERRRLTSRGRRGTLDLSELRNPRYPPRRGSPNNPR